MDKVAVYVRWSTEDQAEGTTLEVQREACIHFILSQGWRYQPDLLFIDDGYSGATMERPALTRLREHCCQGLVDCVVVYKLDRLSRSVVDTVRLVMEEWAGRVSLKSAREPVDTTSPMGRQLFYLLTAYAEWERNVIRERTAAGKWKRAREGRNPGFTPPFGYRSAGEGRFALEPTEAPVVRQIFALAGADMSAGEIARRLNQEGIPGRTGGGWSAQVVAKVLRNPAYTGALTYGRNSGEELRVEGVFPPLVAGDAFEQVQRLRRSRRPATAPVRALAGEALLGGLAACARCGAALAACSRQQGRYRYYRCPCGFLARAPVDEAVLTQAKSLYAGKRVEAAVYDQLRQLLQQHRQRLEAALRKARRGALLADRAADRVRKAFLAGSVDAAQYGALEQRAALQAQEAAAEVERLQQQLSASRGAEMPVLVDPWEPLTMAERKTVLRALVRQVLVDRNGMAITWNASRAA